MDYLRGVDNGSIDFFVLVADCYRLILLRGLFLLLYSQARLLDEAKASVVATDAIIPRRQQFKQA